MAYRFASLFRFFVMFRFLGLFTFAHKLIKSYYIIGGPSNHVKRKQTAGARNPIGVAQICHANVCIYPSQSKSILSWLFNNLNVTMYTNFVFLGGPYSMKIYWFKFSIYTFLTLVMFIFVFVSYPLSILPGPCVRRVFVAAFLQTLYFG